MRTEIGRLDFAVTWIGQSFARDLLSGSLKQAESQESHDSRWYCRRQQT